MGWRSEFQIGKRKSQKPVGVQRKMGEKCLTLCQKQKRKGREPREIQNRRSRLRVIHLPVIVSKNSRLGRGLTAKGRARRMVLHVKLCDYENERHLKARCRDSEGSTGPGRGTREFDQPVTCRQARGTGAGAEGLRASTKARRRATPRRHGSGLDATTLAGRLA